MKVVTLHPSSRQLANDGHRPHRSASTSKRTRIKSVKKRSLSKCTIEIEPKKQKILIPKITHKPKEISMSKEAKANSGDTAIDEPPDDSFNNVEVQEAPKNINPKFALKINPIDFALNYLEYPETVSPFWIPIDEMKNIAFFSENFKRNVEKLKENNFIGWKKSQGDGNCYYRAIMHCYLSHIFNFYTDIHFSSSLIYSIEKIKLQEENLIEIQAKFLKIIDYLRRIKVKNPIQAFSEFIKFTQDEEFDRLAISIGRIITATTLWEKQNDPLFQPFLYEDINVLIGQILTDGVWAGDLDLLALPVGLNIQVKIFGFFENNLSVTLYPEEYKTNDNSIPPISIVRRGGHYDILYSKEEFDRDWYNFETNTYIFDIENKTTLQKSVEKMENQPVKFGKLVALKDILK